jgi:hypothetical protein
LREPNIRAEQRQVAVDAVAREEAGSESPERHPVIGITDGVVPSSNYRFELI